MKRYKHANEGIHAPEEAKEKAARSAAGGSRAPWTGAVAAVLAVAILGGIALWPRGAGGSHAGNPQPRNVSPLADHALALAAYPEMAPYPKYEDYFSGSGDDNAVQKWAKDAYYDALRTWRDSHTALAVNTGFDGVMDEFLTRSTTQFLAGAGEDNRIYSPLNVYMGLSMLAETTGENSRRQILELLQADSIQALRTRAAALWKSSYLDDGLATSILANSLWLRDGMTYSQEVLDRLASDCYASSFSGEMGSEEYNQALRDWLSEQTQGLLEEQAEGLKLEPETVLALASTLCFKAAWNLKFDRERTETDLFHALSGDVEADFMHSTRDGVCYWGDHFSAVRLSFQEGGEMWLILPDEGCTVDELLQSGEAMDFLLADKSDTFDGTGSVVREGWPGRKRSEIHLSMPRFDVSSDLDLIEGLKALGVTDVFDPALSNFDPLGAGTGDPLFVSQVKHAARVKVDEEGCEAAAYTFMALDPTSPPPPDEEMDFTLDRPFLFAIVGENGLPLFTGVVNHP